MNIPEEFGKYLLLEETDRGSARRDLPRRPGRQEGGMEQVVLLRVFNGKGIDGEKLWARVSGRAAVQEILKSPNIGNGVDLGRVRSFPYTAYDYISGKSLATVFAQSARQHSPIPTDHALLIAERLALALAAAYESRVQDERVLHGFVVPHLVMISNEGETRLLGFEVAPGLRDLAAGGWQDAALRPYLSPEALSGAPTARADDVYSLGAILFELLTGERLPAAPPEESSATRIDARPAPQRGHRIAGADRGAAQEEPGAPRAADRRRGHLAQDAVEADDRQQLQPDHVQPRLLHAQPLPRRDRAGEPGDPGREAARAAAAHHGDPAGGGARGGGAGSAARSTGVREVTLSGTRAQSGHRGGALEEGALDRDRRRPPAGAGRRRLLPLRPRRRRRAPVAAAPGDPARGRSRSRRPRPPRRPRSSRRRSRRCSRPAARRWRTSSRGSTTTRSSSSRSSSPTAARRPPAADRPRPPRPSRRPRARRAPRRPEA